MKLTILVIISCLLTSCSGQVSNVKDTSVNLTQGMLIYEVSGQATTSNWSFKVQFDNENVTIDEEYAKGASKKFKYNKETGEILALINEAETFVTEKDSYVLYYTPDKL